MMGELVLSEVKERNKNERSALSAFDTHYSLLIAQIYRDKNLLFQYVTEIQRRFICAQSAFFPFSELSVGARYW